ncbi:hypothetical protein AWC38_SpisGene10306 [Stylophora pistillata]|uniref:Uncharacterized protein n=1 Tax=Stylophora pistillata TaxID=50429 RepID=A0A2B4S974_STYPI|nr:hypothetical protein AWC38_SpisGene10306 [Stylophora pistillata]
MCRMETPMKKPTKGVKGQRHHPYDKRGPLHFKKEWVEKYPDGKVMIDGVPQVAQQSKKNWTKKKNVKNLSLDLNSLVPVMQTPVKVVCPSDNPEMTTEEPLRQLANLVDSIKPDVPQPIQQQPIPQTAPPPPVEVHVLEEGEIPEAGNCQYDTLEDLLASVGVCYPCPIHNSGMNEVHSQKEWIQDVFLTCSVDNCPVFTSLKEYATYYDRCRRQGHEWFNLDRIASMKCECGETPTLDMSKSEYIYNQLSNRESIYFLDLQGLQIAYAMGNATKLEELTREDIFEIAQLIGFDKFKKVSSRLNVSEDELQCIKLDLELYEYAMEK